MEIHHETKPVEEIEVPQNPEEIKQYSMIKLCKEIGYAFKMESPVDYKINGKTYSLTNVAGCVIANAQKRSMIAESLRNSTLK